MTKLLAKFAHGQSSATAIVRPDRRRDFDHYYHRGRHSRSKLNTTFNSVSSALK